MWSELPFDMLVMISEALPLLDFTSFSSVCRSWHHACAVTKHNRFEAPWLVYSGSEHEPRTLNIYAVSERRQFKISNQPCFSFHDKMYIGSAHGWLIIADEKSELSLVNPIAKQQIDLPPTSSLGHFLPIEYDLDGKNILSYLYKNEEEVGLISTSELRYDFYVKATLTSSPSLSDDYVVVIILGKIDCIAFARCGDKEWTKLACVNLRKEISCHNGIVYTIVWSGEVESWDLSQKLCLPEQPITYVPKDEKVVNTLIPYFYYLVPTPWGDMLHVRRRKRDDVHYLTKSIEIFKVDPVSKQLIPVKSIGDYAIFIGGNQPICVSCRCKVNQNIKSNSVYFTDEDFEIIYFHKETSRDMGAYHLEDGSIESIFEHPLLKWPPPIWLQPSLV